MSECTDGAANMTDYRCDVISRIKEVAHNKMLFTHCINLREHLASKKFSLDLKNVLNKAVKIVNAIRSRFSNSRIFQALCESIAVPVGKNIDSQVSKIWVNNNFSSSDKDQKKFSTCRKKFMNVGEDFFFFFRERHGFGTKIEKSEINSK